MPGTLTGRFESMTHEGKIFEVSLLERVLTVLLELAAEYHAGCAWIFEAPKEHNRAAAVAFG